MEASSTGTFWKIYSLPAGVSQRRAAQFIRKLSKTTQFWCQNLGLPHFYLKLWKPSWKKKKQVPYPTFFQEKSSSSKIPLGREIHMWPSNIKQDGDGGQTLRRTDFSWRISGVANVYICMSLASAMVLFRWRSMWDTCSLIAFMRILLFIGIFESRGSSWASA